MSVLQGTVYAAQLVSPSDLTGSTVTCVATAPDLTTTTYTSTGGTVKVTAPAGSTPSTATANIPASQVGTYILVWSSTGGVTGSQQDQFTVRPARMELLSLTDAKQMLNLSTSDASKDEKIRNLIAAAGDVVENITGPIRSTSRTDYFDGGSPQVVLPARWVVSISSVVETWGAVNYTLTEQPLGFSNDAFGYTWDRNTTTITRRTYGGAAACFQPGLRTVAVSYVEGLATIPQSIQEAAGEYVRHNYRRNDVAFRTTAFNAQSGDDAYNLPGNYSVPNAMMELLDPWRRPPGIF